jgi:hypothetical protein
MRLSLWLVGISASALVTAALVAAGCSSSSATPTGDDAASPDSSAEAAAGDASDDGGSPNGCFVDASLSVFASSDASAAGCAACVQLNCSPAITACATDCTCINLFSCLADSGVAMSALGSAAAAAVTACSGNSGIALLQNPGVKGLVDCLSDPCATACNAVLDAGTDDSAAPSEAAAADTGTDAGAGSTADAADTADGG